MKKTEKNSLGYRIRFARDSARLSQQFIASSLGITKRTLIKWEQNESRPKDPMVKEIANITQSDADYLLTGSSAESGAKKENKYSGLPSEKPAPEDESGGDGEQKANKDIDSSSAQGHNSAIQKLQEEAAMWKELAEERKERIAELKARITELEAQIAGKSKSQGRQTS